MRGHRPHTVSTTSTPAATAAPRAGRRSRFLGARTAAAVLVCAAATVGIAGPAAAATSYPLDAASTAAASTPLQAASYTTYRSYWGAIAIGPDSGSAGYSWDYPTAAAAARAAVSRCGARDCQSVVEVANGCASAAQASNGALGWAYAETHAAADRAAIRHTPGPNAKVFGWVCTTGHR